MIHITYIPSTSDDLSSGHILWEIFTTYIFSFLIPNLKPIYNNNWDKCEIITPSSFKKHTSNRLSNYDYIMQLNNYIKWESLSFQDFTIIKNNIEEKSKLFKNILIECSNVCKIHIDQLCLWYSLKYIPTDIYSIYAIPMIKKLYYEDHDNSPIDQIALHIRTGDLSIQFIQHGYTINYYTNIINKLKQIYSIPINIYCEGIDTTNTTCKFVKDNNKHIVHAYIKSIIKLGEIENVFVKLGNFNNLTQQFNEICRSKIVIPSASSFSLFATFISNGIIFIDEKHMITRPNLFKNIKYIPNIKLFNDDTSIINNIL